MVNYFLDLYKFTQNETENLRYWSGYITVFKKIRLWLYISATNSVHLVSREFDNQIIEIFPGVIIVADFKC